MNLKIYSLLLAAVLAFSISTGMAVQSPTGKNEAEQKVLDFVTAFNEKNVDAMLALASARGGRMIDGQFKGQCAYAMYQLADGLIQSVWYFSAHACDKQ